MKQSRFVTLLLLGIGLIGSSLGLLMCFPNLPSVEGVPCLFTSECRDNLVCHQHLCMKSSDVPKNDGVTLQDAGDLTDDNFKTGEEETDEFPAGEGDNEGASNESSSNETSSEESTGAESSDEQATTGENAGEATSEASEPDAGSED